MVAKVFLLLFGVAFVAVGVKMSSLARRMRAFKSVRGRVVAREVATIPSGHTTAGVWGEGGGYTPRVTYRYEVDGVELESDRTAMVIRGYKHAVAERKLAQIPDEVVVWYDPAKPSEACLERSGPALGYFVVALGACFVVGALLALVG